MTEESSNASNTSALMSRIAQNIASNTVLNTYLLESMNPNDFQNLLPDLTLPAAILVHTGTDYSDLPKQTTYFSILVCVCALSDTADTQARAAADLAASQLNLLLLDSRVCTVLHHGERDGTTTILVHEITIKVTEY